MTETMTIGEFAARTGLSVSALRFYANRGLLVPTDVDPANGYRFYAESQVLDGMLIRDLRRLDMPLREIAQTLGLAPAERRALVAQHLRRLERVVERATAVVDAMHTNQAMKDGDMPPTITLQALDLATALDQVLPAAGSDPEVPHLMGVLVEGRDSSVRFVASDRHRLAIRDLVPSALANEFSVVVPAATLRGWRSTLTGPGDVSITMDHREVTVTGAEVDLLAMIVPTTFPDYEPFMQPAAGATSVVVDRVGLLAALQAFDADADADAAGDGDAEPVTLTVSTSELSIVRGGEERQVAAAIDGLARSVALNPSYIADAIANAVGAELVIEVGDTVAPVIFRSADDGTYVSIVMPVKLD